MSNVFVGQITMFGGNFAPRGFALCNGQLLAISQNQALFSLIGTTYGGNGQTTFALPNLQSQLALHYGQGPGQPNYTLGQTAGTPSVTLTTATTPAHTHSLIASQGPADTGTVGSGVLPATSKGTSNAEFYAAQKQGQPALTPVAMDAGVCGPAGGNAPHTNLMPSQCISFVIALTGVFPSRN
jgi:microcystin-dependent protein